MGVVAEDAVEAVDEVEASPSQRNGNPLPSSVDLSRTARSSPLKKSSAVPSTCDSSPLPEELVSFAVQFQRSLCRWPVLKIATPLLAAPPPPLETSPRPLSRLSARPTPSSPQTSGRKKLSPPPP